MTSFGLSHVRGFALRRIRRHSSSGRAHFRLRFLLIRNLPLYQGVADTNAQLFRDLHSGLIKPEGCRVPLNQVGETHCGTQ